MKKPVTINDLKIREEDGSDLTPQQRLALKNFDRYRFSVLSGIKNEDKFHMEFQRLQTMSNLTNHEEFLKDEFL